MADAAQGNTEQSDNVKGIQDMPQVKIDTEKEFREIARSDDEFKESVDNVLQFPQSREDSRKWAKKLRLIFPRRNPAEEPANETNSIRGPLYRCICVCESQRPFPRHYITKRLGLTPPGHFPGCTHYLAVSYRWGTKPDNKSLEPESEKAKPDPPDGCSRWGGTEDKATRPCIAPKNVIRRAVNYAQAQGFPFIWIDQECIDQKDRKDTECGIQAMDIVFQRSSRALGLLNCYVRTQGQMDALGTFMMVKMNQGTRQDDLLEVLNMIVDDEWFTRAWTLQESVAGAHSMELLIRHKRSLKKPTVLGDVEGEIAISIETLGIATLMAHSSAREKQDSDHGKGLRSALSKLDSLLPPNWPPQAPSLSGDQHWRHPHSGLHALKYLERRRNSRPADRLAILANLCDFPVRINTMKAEKKGMSFSICVYLLCIMNGDLSLIGAFANDPTSERLGYSWGPPRRRSLSAALCCWHAYELGGELTRLDQPGLCLDGLCLSGWIWKIEKHLEFHDIKIPMAETIWLVIARLEEEGLTSLAQLIWDFSIPSFASPFTHNTWGSTKERYFCAVFKKRPGHKVMFDALKEHGFLSLGRRVPDGPCKGPKPHPDTEYRGIFYPAMVRESLVVTPRFAQPDDILDRPVQDRVFPWLAWKVECTDRSRDSSVPILKGQGLAEGMFWIQEDDPPQRYIIS